LEQHFPPVHNALAVNCSAGVAETMAASSPPMAIQASSHRDFDTAIVVQPVGGRFSRQVGVAIGK
jgi:hypothetical protein